MISNPSLSGKKQCSKCKTNYVWSTECTNCDWSELQLQCPDCEHREVY